MSKTGVRLDLVGEDGNAFSILGRAGAALRRAGFPQQERDEFLAEATSGDYDHLLRTVMTWFDTTGEEDAILHETRFDDYDEFDPEFGSEPVFSRENDEFGDNQTIKADRRLDNGDVDA